MPLEMSKHPQINSLTGTKQQTTHTDQLSFLITSLRKYLLTSYVRTTKSPARSQRFVIILSLKCKQHPKDPQISNERCFSIPIPNIITNYIYCLLIPLNSRIFQPFSIRTLSTSSIITPQCCPWCITSSLPSFCPIFPFLST